MDTQQVHPSGADFKNMQQELSRLSGVVGDLVTAIKGNDLGTLGMLGEIREMDNRLDVLDMRLAKVEENALKANVEAAKKTFYLMVIWACVGTVAGTLLVTIINHIFSTKA